MAQPRPASPPRATGTTPSPPDDAAYGEAGLEGSGTQIAGTAGPCPGREAYFIPSAADAPEMPGCRTFHAEGAAAPVPAFLRGPSIRMCPPPRQIDARNRNGRLSRSLRSAAWNCRHLSRGTLKQTDSYIPGSASHSRSPGRAGSSLDGVKMPANLRLNYEDLTANNRRRPRQPAGACRARTPVRSDLLL